MMPSARRMHGVGRSALLRNNPIAPGFVPENAPAQAIDPARYEEGTNA